MARVNDLLDRWKLMEARRDLWMSYWQELADVLHPTAGDFLRKIERGERRGDEIFDGSPRLAIRDLAATLDGLLKPKTANWFDVTIEDQDLLRRDDVKRHLEFRREKMWNAVYRSDARFIQRSTEVDMSIVTFGHGILWEDQNRRRDGLLFRSFPIGRSAIDENDEGIIDVVGVEEDKTAAQWVRRFGEEEMSRAILDAFRDPNQRKTEFPFVQLVLPREDRDASKIDSGNMPFASVIIDIKGEHIVREGGFMEFPAAIPRWDTVPGEIYARSPGMMALPDAQTLQAMGKTLLVGGQRAVDPPMGVLNDSVISAVRNFPGGVTVFDTHDTGGTPPVFPFPVSQNIPLGRDMQEDYRRQVEAAFFKDVFSLPVDGPEMTATEVLERKEEFIRVLGPVFGRQETDYVAKIVERTHGIMERTGVFGEVPEALRDQQITFRYQSPIQRARRQLEIAGMSTSLERLAPLAEKQPGILDHFDGDAIARDAPDWAGMPSRWMRTQDDVDALRAQQSQDQQIQQAVDGAAPVAGAIKDVALASKALQ